MEFKSNYPVCKMVVLPEIIDERGRLIASSLQKSTENVPALIWITLMDFSPGAVCLVLASELYDAAEYIPDHAQFLRLSRNALR
jgi:hypothetical protein